MSLAWLGKSLLAALTFWTLSLAQPATVLAAGGVELKSRDWPHQGPFGTYDRASVQRGFQV